MSTGRRAVHIRNSPPKGNILEPLSHLEERVQFIAYKEGSIVFREDWKYKALGEEQVFTETWLYRPFVPASVTWNEPWNPSEFTPNTEEFNEQWKFNGFNIELNFNEPWNPSEFSPGTNKFSESWEAPIS